MPATAFFTRTGMTARHRALAATVAVVATLGLTAVAASAAGGLATAGVDGCASPTPTEVASPTPVTSPTPITSPTPVTSPTQTDSPSPLPSPTEVDSPTPVPSPTGTVDPTPTRSGFPTATATPDPPVVEAAARTEVGRADLPGPPDEPAPSGTVSAEPSGSASADPCDEGKPVLVAIGDSITSGHHKPRLVPTDCDEVNYAYGKRLFEKMKAEKPARWATDDQYQNYAHSGFGTVEVLGGGVNACGKTFDGAQTPIKLAEKLLADHAKKGNFVVMSVGINDTNWVQLLSGITKYTIFKNGAVDAGTCEQLLLFGNADSPKFDGFNFYKTPLMPIKRGDQIDALRKKVSDNVTSIVKRLVAADPGVHIVVLEYYNPSGTGTSPTPAFNGYSGPFLPEACRAPVKLRLDSANELLRKAARDAFAKDDDFTARVDFVNVADLSDPKKLTLQQLFLDELNWNPPQPPGWPHPNATGHTAIATAMFAIVKPKL